MSSKYKEKSQRSGKNPEQQRQLISPPRRSRRLGKEEAEYTKDALDQLQKERRSSSRSRSATPTPSKPAELENVGKELLGESLDENSPRRRRINFDETADQSLLSQSSKNSKGSGTRGKTVHTEFADSTGESDSSDEEEQMIAHTLKQQKSGNASSDFEDKEIEFANEEETAFSENESSGEESDEQSSADAREKIQEKNSVKEEEIESNGHDEDDIGEDDGDSGEEEEESGESDVYEEDIEDPKKVQARRAKLPKSAVDDQFFNLAEMNTFLEMQDKQEEQRQRSAGRLGQYDTAEEMSSLIKSMEEENLKSRSWALQGETMADERKKDELLEQPIEVDFRAAAPPVITEETTAQLEAIIRKRIKDDMFDDVIRKIRVNESFQPYRNPTSVNANIEQNVRKSLAEVYGDKYAKELNRDNEADRSGSSIQAKPQLDPVVEEIKKDLDSLFLQLDALSHFQFRPQPLQQEVKIVNNMPSLHVEEVGPTAAAEPEVNLLAPEEVMRRIKAAPKADEERTETDRKRMRRRKKKKQRILSSIGAMNGDGPGDDAGDGKSKSKGTGKKTSLKKKGRKLDFAGRMHELTSGTKEVAEGAKGKKRKKEGDARAKKKVKHE